MVDLSGHALSFSLQNEVYSFVPTGFFVHRNRFVWLCPTITHVISGPDNQIVTSDNDCILLSLYLLNGSTVTLSSPTRQNHNGLLEVNAFQLHCQRFGPCEIRW